MRRAAIAALLTIALTPGVSMSADPFSDSVRLLRNAVTPQRDGSHLVMLFSLRQLRDPTLRPFFDRLLEHEKWAIQTHAVLGLAEINNGEGVDPWLLSQVQPLAQEAIIITAMEMELLGDESQREALGADLTPIARLLLLAERIRQGHEPNSEVLRSLADDIEYRVAALARLLLAQRGEPQFFIQWFHDHQADSYRRGESRQKAFAILEMIREYELVSLAPWIDEQLDRGIWQDEVRHHAIVTLLTIAPELGNSRWASFATGEDDRLADDGSQSKPSTENRQAASYRDRMQALFMLLALTPDIPIDLLERIEGEESLLRAIIDAAKAFKLQTDAAEVMLALFDRAHQRSMEWVVAAARYLPADQQEQIYVGVLDRLDDPPINQSSYTSLAIPAVAKLVALNPEAVEQRLLKTERNSHAREVILLGLFETSDPIAARIASELPRIGIGRSDSMALLLIAKHTDSLAREDVQQLGSIASGAGRVSMVLRVQAAWLYLKHSNQIEPALARIW